MPSRPTRLRLRRSTAARSKGTSCNVCHHHVHFACPPKSWSSSSPERPVSWLLATAWHICSQPNSSSMIAMCSAAERPPSRSWSSRSEIAAAVAHRSVRTVSNQADNLDTESGERTFSVGGRSRLCPLQRRLQLPHRQRNHRPVRRFPTRPLSRPLLLPVDPWLAPFGSHSLGRISPILPPFFPVFCAFSPS